MYAIVEIAGQQFKVAKDQNVFVHRLAAAEGNRVVFDKVLLLDDGKITIGAPAIEGAAVEAKILRHLKGDKVIVFKKKRRKGYRVKNGHRQLFTEINIENIIASSAEKVAPAKTKDTPEKSEMQSIPEAEVTAEVSAPEPEEKTVLKKDVTPETALTPEELSKKTVAVLKEMARAKGITGISSMKKADLIAALCDTE